MPDTLSIKEAHDQKLLQLPNVVGTAVGVKYVDGKPTDQPAVLVFVQKKLTEKGIIRKFSADEIVPQSLDDVPTDVIEVGTIVKHFRSRVRPLEPGYSVGHGAITAGTIGGFFIDRDGDLVALSNNHVLANENSATIGDPIFQPGPSDGQYNKQFNGWPDPIANLPYFATLKQFVKINRKNNNQDSAIATVHKKFLELGLVSPIYPTIGQRAAGFDTAKVNDQVQKCGRTSGYSTGKVIGLHGTFTIGYDFGEAEFNDCVVITNMSKPGDSGSVIYDLDMNAVALLFAGSNKVTIATPIEVVRAQYGLQIWDGGAATPPINVGNLQWDLFARHGKITFTDNLLAIEDNGNHACYAQVRIGKFKSVECVVNTGSDAGATWGPGLVAQWPNATMKVNLRSQGTFGGYFNNDENINAGRTKPNTDYVLRIRQDNNKYIGEVKDGDQWITMVAVPSSVFRGDPVCVRIGKTGVGGGATDYGVPGPVGTCTIKDFKIS